MSKLEQVFEKIHNMLSMGPEGRETCEECYVVAKEFYAYCEMILPKIQALQKVFYKVESIQVLQYFLLTDEYFRDAVDNLTACLNDHARKPGMSVVITTDILEYVLKKK